MIWTLNRWLRAPISLLAFPLIAIVAIAEFIINLCAGAVRAWPAAAFAFRSWPWRNLWLALTFREPK